MPPASEVLLRDLARRREAAFGKYALLSYERPVEAVRARGATIWDAEGRAYLDAYNNVPHVGHCHPAVVAAGQRQLAALNVHSRYLHEGVTAYAERLLACFPVELGRVAFTCTGSEANDLALRMARAKSGHEGVITSSFNYHGNTARLSQLATALPSHMARPAWAEAIDISACPDRETLAAAVERSIAALSSRGFGTAALLLDPIFAFEGILVRPPDYLDDAVAALRRAGGCYIADEVQSGFGRLGTMWGWQQFGPVPDIVTLGKPMANGYPMAAAVSRPDIGDAFAASEIYFNTFAASPVGAAMADAVLDVIASEVLVGHAAETGDYALASLAAIAGGERVRGRGLYIGIDLGSADAASRCMNRMRDRQILVGTTGVNGSVIKIRPPLCIGRSDIDRLAHVFQESLGEE